MGDDYKRGGLTLDDTMERKNHLSEGNMIFPLGQKFDFYKEEFPFPTHDTSIMSRINRN